MMSGIGLHLPGMMKCLARRDLCVVWLFEGSWEWGLGWFLEAW